eukprot:12508725-Prorocentrum_lima.AAC.1
MQNRVTHQCPCQALPFQLGSQAAVQHPVLVQPVSTAARRTHTTKICTRTRTQSPKERTT